MSRQRKFTDETCKALADWFSRLREMGTVASKARDNNVSEKAIRDAIARGNGTYESRVQKHLSDDEISKLVDTIV